MMRHGDTKVEGSGEVHSDWRERLQAGVEEKGLPVELILEYVSRQ